MFGSDNQDDDKDKKIDLEVLDRIIANCEKGMSSKWKAKDDEGSPEEESMESKDEEDKEDDDMSGPDMDDLLEMYQEMKRGK